MASNATLNIHNNVQHPSTSFTTPISISTNNTINSVNKDKKEDQYLSPILNNENQQRPFVNYSIPNNYVHENNKVANRKRRLSTSSNTSISSNTLINTNNNTNNTNNTNTNNYEDDCVSNNPRDANSNYQIKATEANLVVPQNHPTNNNPTRTSPSNHPMTINNTLPMSLFHNSSQNPSEHLYIPNNKSKKQKIEFNTQQLQPQPQTQPLEKIIQHQQIDKEIKISSQKRVDSFANDNENNIISKEEFDIPNSMNYMYTREGQPSLIQNSNQPCNEIDNEINQLDEENELNQNQCYYHNKTSINNLKNKISFENEANIDKFSKFNKKFNTNINDSTSIATLKTMNNRNELKNIGNINNTISINNKNNLNKLSPTSPTAVFHQTIEYPTSINVNVNTSISIPQVTTTTTIKPLIQNSTNLYSPVNKDNTSPPITTTTTLIPYSFQTSSAPIATFSTVTTTHSPKVNSQNADNNTNGTSSLMAIEGLHVSSPYYHNIYNNNNYVMSQMGKSSYNISSLSNSPKSPVRQSQPTHISNKNVLFHSPLRNSINNNSDNDSNNNMSYPYYKNNGPCYQESINEENPNDGKPHNDMNQQQQQNYGNYCNSTGSIVKSKMNHQSLLKNITTSNYLKRNMNQACTSPIKKNISNLNMYMVDQNKDHNRNQLPSPPLTGLEDNVHFDFMANGNPNRSIYVNDYKIYPNNKAYPFGYSPISPDKNPYPLLKNNDQNVYNYNQLSTPISSKFNNDDVKIIDNNIIINNMRVVPQNNSGNMEMMNLANKDLKENLNGEGEDKVQRAYYSDTKPEYENPINNAFVKPMNKSLSNESGNLPSKKKFKVDNEMNLSNNTSFKIIYSKKYSIGKSSKFKSSNAALPLPPQPNAIYPMNVKVKEDLLMNNAKNENHNYHSQPPYTLPYTTMATAVIAAPTPNNPLKALDKNSALLTPMPIPQPIPNRKVNNVILNPNLVPLSEEISNDNNNIQQQNQMSNQPLSQQQSKHQRKIISSQLYQNPPPPPPVYDVNSLNMNTINRMYTANKTKNLSQNNGKSIILPPPPSSMPVFVPMNIPINLNNNNNMPQITLSAPTPSSPNLMTVNQQCSMVQQKSLQNNNNYSHPLHYSTPCYAHNSPNNINTSIPINTNSPIIKKQVTNSNSHGNPMPLQQNPTANYQIPNVPSEIDQNHNQIQVQNQNNMALKRKHVNTKRISSGQEVISDDGSVTWKIVKQLGKGGCGEVYLAQFVSGKKQPYKYCAIKFIKNKKVFYAETNTMKFLMDNTLCDYSPKIYSSCPKQRFLLMEYIQGENLTQKFESCGHYFTLKTMLMVLMELMRLTKEFYTSTGLVHVDIKPSNFMVDVKNKIYLIDFGYATAPNVKLPGQTGTPLFMSQAIQSQGTICPSFQDDIESIGYVMMYFLKGGKLGLPWGLFKTHSEIVAAKTDANIYNFFLELKGTEYEPICNLLYNFLTVSRKRDIPFDENEYNKLYDSIVKVFNDCGFVNDQCYDWNNIPKKA